MTRDEMLKVVVVELKALPNFTDEREMRVWWALVDARMALPEAQPTKKENA